MFTKYHHKILTHGYLQFLYVYFARLYLQGQPPIIIYQMGKVGSTSVHMSLRLQGFKSFHTHRLGPRSTVDKRDTAFMTPAQRLQRKFHLKQRALVSNGLLNKVIRPNHSVKIISLVRDPISRNVSGFFENPWRFTGNEPPDQINQQTLTNIFLDKFEHNTPLIWFDNNLKLILDIDIYQYPFPQQQGYQITRQGKYELLILKLELSDEIKEKAIANFLNVPSFSLHKANEGKRKPYGNVYQSFKKNLKLPSSYIDSMCNANYTRHFYSPAEIAKIRATWQQSP